MLRDDRRPESYAPDLNRLSQEIQYLASPDGSRVTSKFFGVGHEGFAMPRKAMSWVS